MWWGNEFSCTLHIAGNTLKALQNILLERLKKEKKLFFCIQDNPWDYHFEKSNYVPIEELSSASIENHIKAHGFIKISDKIPLDNWEEYENFSLTTWKRFVKLLI